MKCPHCNHPIPAYKTVLITRWTFVQCKHCERRFGRKLDLQTLVISFLVMVGFIVPLSLLLSLAEMRFIDAYLTSWLIFVLLSPGLIFLDAATIKLMPVDNNDHQEA